MSNTQNNNNDEFVDVSLEQLEQDLGAISQDIQSQIEAIQSKIEDIEKQVESDNKIDFTTIPENFKELSNKLEEFNNNPYVDANLFGKYKDTIADKLEQLFSKVVFTNPQNIDTNNDDKNTVISTFKEFCKYDKEITEKYTKRADLLMLLCTPSEVINRAANKYKVINLQPKIDVQSINKNNIVDEITSAFINEDRINHLIKLQNNDKLNFESKDPADYLETNRLTSLESIKIKNSIKYIVETSKDELLKSQENKIGKVEFLIELIKVVIDKITYYATRRYIPYAKDYEKFNPKDENQKVNNTTSEQTQNNQLENKQDIKTNAIDSQKQGFSTKIKEVWSKAKESWQDTKSKATDNIKNNRINKIMNEKITPKDQKSR